jgi:hypothetical protein
VECIEFISHEESPDTKSILCSDFMFLCVMVGLAMTVEKAIYILWHIAWDKGEESEDG